MECLRAALRTLPAQGNATLLLSPECAADLRTALTSWQSAPPRLADILTVASVLWFRFHLGRQAEHTREMAIALNLLETVAQADEQPAADALGRMFIMEGMGKQRRPRRAFTPEFKAEIVEVCRRGLFERQKTAGDATSRWRSSIAA